MSTTMLRLDNVSRTYPGGLQALSEVSFGVKQGEYVAIVGPSGSGKSTLLNLVGTLDRPSSGHVHIAGHDLVGLTDRQISALRARHIGFVFQQFHLEPTISALDNVVAGLLYRGVSFTRRRHRAADTLRRVGLQHRLHHRPNELSGGEQQRVAIARALVGEPALLLADEPTGNLDTASGAEIVGLLDDLHGAGTTVLLITHDRELAEALPRQVRMCDGRIVADTRVQNRTVVVGEPS